ncbi:MAG: hypothetical protein P8X62_10650 [Flavobacteriaceae bacterium]
MKTTGHFKIGLSVVLIAVLSLYSIKTFANKAQKSEQTNSDNISVTIDSKTTSENFTEIKEMLIEYGITVTFSNIERNDLGELTGLKIILEDQNGNQATRQMSSNQPISQIVFGRKDGLVFISPSNKENGAFAFFNQPNMMPFNFDRDSIFKQHFRSFGNLYFDDFFDDENDSFFFNGKSMNLNELREQMKKQFNDFNSESDDFSWFFDSDGSKEKFKFYDNPKTNKLIIIDGEESNFKMLKELAEDDKLDTVDELKPKTAISIYGTKAKDGVIIATTKE